MGYLPFFVSAYVGEVLYPVFFLIFAQYPVFLDEFIDIVLTVVFNFKRYSFKVAGVDDRAEYDPSRGEIFDSVPELCNIFTDLLHRPVLFSLPEKNDCRAPVNNIQ